MLFEKVKPYCFSASQFNTNLHCNKFKISNGDGSQLLSSCWMLLTPTSRRPLFPKAGSWASFLWVSLGMFRFLPISPDHEPARLVTSVHRCEV